MKYLFLFTMILSPFFASANYMGDEWGQTGHRVTGKIAEQYLSKKAKRKIDKLLDGQSLAFVSTYGDDIKSDPEFKKYGPWHYVNLPQGAVEYKRHEAAEGGDLVTAIEHCIAVLKSDTTSKDEKAFHLKLLVHFVGDLHQPMHTGRGEDKGGNDIQVQYFNKGSNLHRVWDSEMIEGFGMSYTELARNTEDLSKGKIKEIASGSLLDWMYDSKALSEKVYASVESGDKLYYAYSYEWFPVVMEQLHKGGIRLATILNDIYS